MIHSNNSSHTSIPKLKLGYAHSDSKNTSITRESMLYLYQKQQIENQQMINQKINTPGSFTRPINKQLGAFNTTPKDSPLYSQKALQDSASTRTGAFSDYYNKEVQKQSSRLPSISKSNSTNKLVSQEEFSIRPKNSTFSSDVSNFDQASTASTQDNLNFVGKSQFFKPSQFQSVSKDSSVLEPVITQQQSSNQNQMVKSLNGSMIRKEHNLSQHAYSQAVDSPQNQSDLTAFLNKQQQQQKTIKALHEEQKKQLQRVEDITSPFPPKGQRKRPTSRMSLNVISLSDLTSAVPLQKQVLNEQLGGETNFKAFVDTLIYAMKKIEFFEVFFEEFQAKAEQVKLRIQTFIMNVFTNNYAACLAAVQDFLNTFNSLTDSNIFELKYFLIQFLTGSNASNNSFPDKLIAFKLIEILEVFRNEITGNESVTNLFEVSSYSLVSSIAENLVTCEFFRKFELDKINSLSKSIIQLIFNKTSCTNFITEFETLFQVSLTPGTLGLLRDVLKKSLSDLNEYSAIFRKNVSYQLKKVQWLLPSPQPSYFSIIQNASDSLFPAIDKILEQASTNQIQQKVFTTLIRACYSPHNIFNIVDTIELITSLRDIEQQNEIYTKLCSALKQALISCKVNADTAKKIEVFTLSIFE